jgi:AcrR family transcriptional regulator
MEEIVAQSGVAKTTIYRHFPTKDELVRAVLDREDAEFWTQWDEIVGKHDGQAALDVLCEWIGQRVLRDNYRGCPQINAAAEFSDPQHQARAVARKHKDEMHRRITQLCASAGVDRPDEVAMQITLLFDGAFTSSGRLAGRDAAALLSDAVRRLLQTDR